MTGQVRTGQVGTSHVRTGQVGIGHLGTGQVGIGHLGTGQVSNTSNWDSSGRDRSSQDRVCQETHDFETYWSNLGMSAILQTRSSSVALLSPTCINILLTPQAGPKFKAWNIAAETCYFPDQRKLRYFTSYMQDNCKRECSWNK